MKLLPLLCILSGCVASAHGAAIVWNSSIDNGLALAGGTTMLPTNSLVRLGYFDISDSLIQSNATNLAFLESNFHQLDFDRIGGSEVNGFAGYFAEQVDLNTGSLGLNITGKQLVIWALASTDNSNLAQSLATATQTGIFYMDKSADSRWAVPGDTPDLATPGSTHIDLSQLTGSGTTADLLPGAKVLVGSYTANQAGQANARNFALQAVPEPTSAGLAIVGGMAMLLHRRRRA